MNPSSLGYISKIEPFGTFDGPGIRSIIFLSGCPLRCLYCHNPETWQAQIGNRKTPEEITEMALKKQALLRGFGRGDLQRGRTPQPAGISAGMLEVA